MHLMKKDALEFASAELNTFNLENIEINRELAKTFLAEELIEDFKNLNSSQTKRARTQYFDFKGVKPDDFSERLIDLGRGRKAICGIRHKGANPKYPFVQMKPSFELEPPDCQRIYQEFLEEHFSIFNPQHIQLWSSKYREDGTTYSCYLVTSMDGLLKMESWGEEKTIEFENLTDHSYYPWYESIYEDFHRHHPELEHRVAINGKSEMETSLKHGLLKSIFMKGEKIGLIGAERSSFLGQEGIYFTEILLTSNYRGRGLAKAIQRKFLLDFAKPKDFIWGTIDYQNKASFRTAMSNGRKPIRFETFVNLKK